MHFLSKKLVFMLFLAHETTIYTRVTFFVWRGESGESREQFNIYGKSICLKSPTTNVMWMKEVSDISAEVGTMS